jgi:hypothetical protein
MNTPQKAITIPTTLPTLVLGKKSPYPTVVIVTIIFHSVFEIKLKSYPETSDRGPSNILKQYPIYAIDIRSEIIRTL